MSSDKINQLFWLYYGQAIKDKAGANFGSTGAFFLATEAQKGPVAGDNIPDEYTYQGLYDIGNNLLAADNLFYNPSALHGYAQALQTYLNWVDLGGKPSAAQDSRLLSALQDQAAFQTAYELERAKAANQWKGDKELELTKLSFPDYVAAGKTPGFTAAIKQLKDVASTIQQIQSEISGPMAATISDDRALLAKGFDMERDYPGFNMLGAIGNLLSPQELLRKFSSGQKVPAPDSQRIPAYNAPAYKQAVQAAMRKAGGDYKPDKSVSFAIDTGKSTSSFDFGQTTAGASVGASFGGWFSFNAQGSHSSEDSTLQTGEESSNVSVNITYDTIQLVPITPGSWNIDVTKYKLRKDAPEDVKSLARVTQLVIATGLGYEITVGSSTASTIDSKMKETTSGGGSISIFGIPISVGGSGSHTTENDSHTATWDNANKTFKVVPALDVGFATVVGVVGEKFNIL